MSEATEPNDGPYLRCRPLVGSPIGGTHPEIVGGHCFDCNEEMDSDMVLITYNQHQLKFIHQCENCGHNNTLLEATVTTLKCEPSLNRVTT